MCDFRLWEFLKGSLYQGHARVIANLKDRTPLQLKQISCDMLRANVEIVVYHIQNVYSFNKLKLKL